MTFTHYQQNLFADDATSSVPDSLANHSAKPENAPDHSMSDISFPKSLRLWHQFAQPSAFLRTFADCLVSNLGKYSPTLSHHWKGKATRSLRFVFQLQPSVRRTGEIGCGLWDEDEMEEAMMLGTPRATQRVRLARFRKGRTPSPEEAMEELTMLLTPTASENVQDVEKFKKRMEKYPNGTTMPNLATQISVLLPTPIAGDWKGQKRKDGTASMLSGKIALLLTPTTQEIEHSDAELTHTGRRKSKSGKTSHSLNLADTIMLRTPDANMGKLIPTPAARDYRGANSKEHRQKEGRQHHGQLPNVLATDGEKTGSTLRLEPVFVEHLMGFPIGWTSLEDE